MSNSKTLVINEAAKTLINRYNSLQLGGKSVVCPYFINIHKARDLRVMLGKGTPDEIEMEAKMWAKLKGANFEEMSTTQIRQFLMDRGIGIDCSGFVVHVLDAWFKAKQGKSIFRSLKPYGTSLRRKIAYWLRPAENMGAENITNAENCTEVGIAKVKPGDLIRSKWKRKNSHHVLLVHEVIKDENDNVKVIKYVNSTEQYGDNNGIRFAEIIIKDQSKPLHQQQWNDDDENGVNHTLEGYMFNLEDNGIRRLKCLG